MIWSTDLSKNVLKNPQNNDKTVQSTMLWLNLNKINEIFFFLQSAHKQGNPSFHFHAPGSKRRYPCTQTASAVPKYFPCRLPFCTGYRIWHASRAWKQKTFIFTQLKISRYNPHFFAIFRRIFYKSDLRPIYCSLTCSHTSTFFLGNNTPFSDIWVIFNCRMASFVEVCPISPKIWSV